MPVMRFESLARRLLGARHRSGELPRSTEHPEFRGHPDQGFGHLTYAQFGEDLIVLNIFHRLGIPRPSYMDVGAHHPVNISNTALLHARGSRGVNIEANPNLIGEFRRLRPEDVNLNVGVGPERGALDFYYIDDWSGRNTFSREAAERFVEENPAFRIRKIEKIPIATLDDIVAEHMKGRWPDFLSIDVEGLDFAVLEAAHFGADRPLVICAEAVSGADDDASDSLIGLLESRGFAIEFRTAANLIFSRRNQSASGSKVYTV